MAWMNRLKRGLAALRWQRWQQCTGTGGLTQILGIPPEPWLNLDDANWVSPPGDVCPNELWYDVTHLEQAVARGDDSMVFVIEAAATIQDELACTARQHQLEQYRFADSMTAMFNVSSTHFSGAGCDPK